MLDTCGSSLATKMASTVLRSLARAARPAMLSDGLSDAAPAGLTLNFCLPHEAVYFGKTVEQVIIPGAEGEYGVTAGHSPIASQLKPGVLQIIHAAGEEPEKYFVSGGFALSHESSVTDISAVEACKLDDIDPEAVKESYAAAKAKFDSSSDEMKKATVQVTMETSRALALAVGVAV